MLKVYAQRSGSTAILRLRGRIVIGETSALRDGVLSRLDMSVIVLDLTRVSRIDAHGLGLMLELRAELQSKGIELRLMNVTKLVQQIIEIARLDTVFETKSEAEVLSAVSQGDEVSKATERDERAEALGTT